MRRLILLLVVFVLVLAACGGDDDEGAPIPTEVLQASPVSPTATPTSTPTVDPELVGTPVEGEPTARPDSLAPTLPPARTVGADTADTATPEGAAASNQDEPTARPDSGAPTLPPPATSDGSNAPDDVSNGSGNTGNGNDSGTDSSNPDTGGPGSGDGSTGSGGNPPGGNGNSEPTSRPDSGAPTLPPAATLSRPTLTPRPTSTTTVTPEPVNTALPVDLPPYCESFVADSDRNEENYDVPFGDDVTIYWFPVNATDYTYLVQLFGGNLQQLQTDFVDGGMLQYEYTFDGELFNFSNNVYYWSVTPYKNNLPADCPPLSDEIFIRD